MKLSGGDLLMRALKDEGVKFIFGYPGGAALHIYDSIFKQKACEHILVRHEQGATHSAQVSQEFQERLVLQLQLQDQELQI